MEGDRQRGFTLVELLVVLVIMALLGAVAITTIPQPPSDAERAARAVAARLPALSDEAIVQARPLGLAVEDGLSVQAFGEAGWAAREVIAVPDGVRLTLAPADEILPPDPPPSGTLLVYRPPGARDAAPPPPPPPVLFSPTGEVTPFVLTVTGDETWRVAVDGDGAAEVSRAD